MDPLNRESRPSRRDVLVAVAAVLGVNALGALPAVFVGADTG